jgi:signal transduction histidine kinase
LPGGPRRLNLPLIADPGLEQLEHVFDECLGERVIPQDARDRAYRRARALSGVLAGGAGAEQIVLLDFAGELFVGAVELDPQLPQLRRLIDLVEGVTGIPRVALGHKVLQSPQLLELSAAVAIDAELTLLLAFANARAVSLWALGDGGALRQIAQTGEADLDDPDTRRLADRLLSGQTPPPITEESISGVLIDRSGQSPRALVLRGTAASSGDCVLLLETAAPIVSATVVRDELASGGGGSHGSALASAERMLSRLRFDLHDGPQQDVVMLGEDLRLFRDQLATVIESNGHRDRILGRIDDLHARLVALDGDLRRISSSLQSPFLHPEALPVAIAQLVETFRARTAIDPHVELHGEFTGLSDSQQITLLALIREALSNVREHSEAEHVTITLAAGLDTVEATVTDDGQGFDPERALVTAARDGHLGLVGMHERVRMLGGQTRIESRPGGPTVISVTLPSMAALQRSSR